MKVLLFGGTFDPPHQGHIHLLQAAIRAVQPDKVIVMPSCLPPHKASSATPAPLRLAMCRCFEGLHPALEVSGWEIEKGGKSYTVDTVDMLAQRWPGAQVYLSVGSDMLLTFTEWRGWQRLLARTVLVAQSRQPGDEEALREAARGLEACGGRIVFTGETALAASSTAIRGQKGWAQVPEEALQVIRRYRLYKPRPPLTARRARELARAALSEKRYAHTLNVKKLAVKLARQYGAEPKKAALAALLHDIAKELPKAELLQILLDNAIIAPDAPQRPAPVWHGICAALLAWERWGVQDPEVLHAIAGHTTGRPGMGRLDKIIFLADMCSAERTYPEVHALRAVLERDLDEAMVEALGKNIQWMEESGKPVDPMSRAAYADLRRTQKLEAEPK